MFATQKWMLQKTLRVNRILTFSITNCHRHVLRSRSHNKLGNIVRDEKIYHEVRREKQRQLYSGTITKQYKSNNEDSTKGNATQRISRPCGNKWKGRLNKEKNDWQVLRQEWETYLMLFPWHTGKACTCCIDTCSISCRVCEGRSCANSHNTPYKAYMGNSPKCCVHALKHFSQVIPEVYHI